MNRVMSGAGQPRRLAIPALAVLSLLGGCGGGGGAVNSTPAATPPATPPPTPSPSPTPTPPPSSLLSAESFRTAEYNRSDGPVYHNVIPAWQTGASGKGVTLGIVDTGIDTANTEFSGRIAAASRDVVASRSVNGTDSHGTQVALTAAAARDNSGIVGIAYEATILMARADDVNSCSSSCTFSDGSIAAGIDLAVANGAKVINLSLGGSGADSNLLRAVTNASAKGVVVVIAAGNNGASMPSSFAAALRQAGAGNVIIAGSVNNQGAMSSFSNRAGSEANYYLSALGEQVCCVYQGSQIRNTTDSSGQTYYSVVSGTSFAAPQIAGAVALLLQAFPNLTAQQVVELLLSSARDAGTAGVDSTYGRGIMDIGSAFAAKGTATLAGTSTVLQPSASSLITSAAMGDGLRAASWHATILDSYKRAYSVNLASTAHRAAVAPRLGQALLSSGRPVSFGTEKLALAFTTSTGGLGSAWTGQLRLSRDDAEAARVIAGRIVARIAPGAEAAFGFATGADGLAAQLRGAAQPAFLVAQSASEDLGFARSDILSNATRFRLDRYDRFGLTIASESARVAPSTSTARLLGLTERDAPRVTRFGATLDKRFGDLATTLAASWLAEDRSVLGARLAQGLDARGADSLFVDFGASWQLAPRWSLGGTYRRGYTQARGGGMLTAGSRLASSAWNLDLVRNGVFAAHDSLALRLAQPLRVEQGGLVFRLPTSWNYSTLSAVTTAQRINLTPSGREVDAELGWSGWLGAGTASATLFWRHDPGHIRALGDEQGAALRWSLNF